MVVRWSSGATQRPLVIWGDPDAIGQVVHGPRLFPVPSHHLLPVRKRIFYLLPDIPTVWKQQESPAQPADKKACCNFGLTHHRMQVKVDSSHPRQYG